MDDIRDALSKSLEERVTTAGSARYEAFKDAAEKLLGVRLSETATSSASAIVSAITNCFGPLSQARSLSLWRAKAQSSFHSVRVTILPELWHPILHEAQIPLDDPLLPQTVSQALFDAVTLSKTSKFQHTKGLTYVSLTVEEENALRYAAGYVPHKLLKKYRANPSKTSDAFIFCLQSMELPDEVDQSVVDHQQYTFHDYTTAWIEKINRGGLYRISDATYKLFYYMECKVRAILPQQLMTQSSTKASVVEAVRDDSYVKDQWTILSSDIESEDDDVALSLLSEIVTVWVTMRGFSICAAWMEEYKAAKSKTTRKSKSLRKTIRKTAD